MLVDDSAGAILPGPTPGLAAADLDDSAVLVHGDVEQRAGNSLERVGDGAVSSGPPFADALTYPEHCPHSTRHDARVDMCSLCSSAAGLLDPIERVHPHDDARAVIEAVAEAMRPRRGRPRNTMQLRPRRARVTSHVES